MLRKTIFLSTIITILFSTFVFAKDIRIFIFGEEIEYNTKPIIHEKKIMIPVKETFESFGFEVFEDFDYNIASLTNEDTEIIFEIGTNEFLVNGALIELDDSSIIINEILFMPLTFINDLTYFTMTWSPEFNSAYIDYEETNLETIAINDYDSGYEINNVPELTNTVQETETAVPILNDSKGGKDNPYLLGDTIKVESKRDIKEFAFEEVYRGKKAEMIMKTLNLKPNLKENEEFFITRLTINAIKSNIPNETAFIGLPILKTTIQGKDENLKFLYSKVARDSIGKMLPNEITSVWVAQIVSKDQDIIIKNICDGVESFIKLESSKKDLNYLAEEYNDFLDIINFVSPEDEHFAATYFWNAGEDILFGLSDCIDIMIANGFRFDIIEEAPVLVRNKSVMVFILEENELFGIMFYDYE